MNSNLHPMLKIVLIKVCCQELWNILLALIFKLSNPRMEILHAKNCFNVARYDELYSFEVFLFGLP